MMFPELDFSTVKFTKFEDFNQYIVDLENYKLKLLGLNDLTNSDLFKEFLARFNIDLDSPELNLATIQKILNSIFLQHLFLINTKLNTVNYPKEEVRNLKNVTDTLNTFTGIRYMVDVNQAIKLLETEGYVITPTNKLKLDGN